VHVRGAVNRGRRRILGAWASEGKEERGGRGTKSFKPPFFRLPVGGGGNNGCVVGGEFHKKKSWGVKVENGKGPERLKLEREPTGHPLSATKVVGFMSFNPKKKKTPQGGRGEHGKPVE